ncbi:MAG: hypothetical protein U0522_00995 [Candidatus Paceibacterota bacterium]
MQEEDYKKILQNQIKILPDDVRDLILSTELESKINWVAGKYNLSPDQTESLKQETLFVLIGLTHLMEYTDNIMHELSIPKEQARIIAQEIGAQVFSEVKDSIKELGWLIEMKREQLGQSSQKSTPDTTPASNPTIITKKEEIVPNVPIAGVLIEQTEKEVPVSENKPSRAVLLDQIENPTLISEHTGTIVDQKLSGITKIPREEVKISMQNMPVTAPAQVTPPQTKPAPITPPPTAPTPAKKYDGPDPYREPIQ